MVPFSRKGNIGILHTIALALDICINILLSLNMLKKSFACGHKPLGIYKSAVNNVRAPLTANFLEENT